VNTRTVQQHLGNTLFLHTYRYVLWQVTSSGRLKMTDQKEI